MKKSILALGTVFLLGTGLLTDGVVTKPLTANAAAISPTSSTRTEYIVNADILNVRSGAGTNYKIIGTVKQGTELSVLSRTANGWYKINYNGSIGYVSCKYVSTRTVSITPSQDLAKIVASSKTAQKTSQIITVIASGNVATVTLFEKINGVWKQSLTTQGHIGSAGIGKASEYTSNTPEGAYPLGFAFGTSNPGTLVPFRKIDNNSYWISNVNDPQYNTWQERTSSSKLDEHLSQYPVQYKYAMVIDYNTNHPVKGVGSAFFLHVSDGRPTAGCVAVPESVMLDFMKNIKPGAYIVNVKTQSEISQY